MKLRKSSQSIIDFAVTLVAVAALTIGIVRIWVWFNANYAKRQISYQQSRLIAAGRSRPGDNFKPAKIGAEPDIVDKYTKPINIGATQACPDCEYQGLDLTEDWVFKGKPSGTVTGAPLGDVSRFSARGCDDSCTSACNNQPGCGSRDNDTFNPLCDCYSACEAKCHCDDQITTLVDIYKKQILNICGPDMNCNRCTCCYGECNTAAGCGQACSMRKGAKSMRDKAKKIKWYKPAYWAGGKRSKKKLKQGAKNLENNAVYLENSARQLDERIKEIQSCCADNKTTALQKLCLDKVEMKADCTDQCLKNTSGGIATQSEFDDCYKHCIAEQYPCTNRTDDIANELRAAIEELKEEKDKINVEIDNINKTLFDCAASAHKTCDDGCSQKCIVCDANGACGVDAKCYQPCYDECYAIERSACCKNSCSENCGLPDEEKWGRDCDAPTENCDTGCACLEEGDCECPACGLSTLASNSQKEIEGIDAEIAKWEQAIKDLPDCCKQFNTDDPKDKNFNDNLVKQTDCINAKISEQED